MSNEQRPKGDNVALSAGLDLPPRDADEFYGDRYSVPVLCWPPYSQRPWNDLLMWDYRRCGWVSANLSKGADPEDYDFAVDEWILPARPNSGINRSREAASG